MLTVHLKKLIMLQLVQSVLNCIFLNVIYALTRNQKLLFYFNIITMIEKHIIIKCYLKQLNINVYAGRLVLLTKEFKIP